MELAAHSTKVCLRKVGQAQRQWTQCLLPLRSVTGAMPTHFWTAAASAKRSRCLPNAANNLDANTGPAPGRLAKRWKSGRASHRLAMSTSRRAMPVERARSCGSSVATTASVDDRGAVFEHGRLGGGGAWDLQADVVFTISPVDSDEG